jgi:hypothetical protein
MENKIPQNMPELLSAIEHEWKELWRVLGRLTPVQMITPDAGGWSPRDNLAHLAEWMNILMGYHMDRRPAHEVMGVSPEVTRGWDMYIINPVLFERNRGRSTDEVLGEIKRVYGALMLKLRSMPFEAVLQPRHADDPERQPVLNWILGDTTEHFAEHRATMEKLL